MSRWKQTNVNEKTLKQREWLLTSTGRAYMEARKIQQKEYRTKNRLKVILGQKTAYQRVRKEALSHYSGGDIKCACCGERGIVFLTIDHIHGGGAEHRRQIDPHKKMGGNGFCYWLKKNNWPEGFQVLCANCNFGKRANVQCPHELMKQTEDYSI